MRKRTGRKFQITDIIFISFIAVLLPTLLAVVSISFFSLKSEEEKRQVERLQGTVLSQTKMMDDFVRRVETAADLAVDSGYAYLSGMSGEGESLRDYVQVFQNLKWGFENMMDTVVGEESSYAFFYFIDPKYGICSILPSYSEKYIVSRLPDNKVMICTENEKTLSECFGQKDLIREKQGIWISAEGKNLYYIKQMADTVYQGTNFISYDIGTLVLKIDMSWFEARLRESLLGQDIWFAIENRENELIYSNNIEKYSKYVPDAVNADSMFAETGDVRYLVLRTGVGIGGTMTVVVEKPRIQISEIMNLILPTSFWVAAMALCLGWIVTKSVTGPVVRLAEHMKAAKNKESTEWLVQTVDDESSIAEVAILYESYNNMIEHIGRLVEEIYSHIETQKETERQLLVAQINPHFVYNTLDSICCIAMLRKEDDIVEGLSSLASVLRYNLRQNEQLVHLGRELEIIGNYTVIQKLCYGDRFDCVFNKPDSDLGKCLVPKMLIQPLVENSIRHGSSSEEECLLVWISCIRIDKELYITVTDSGKRADTELMNRYLEGKAELLRTDSGIGIRNVNDRIHMIYGEKYGLHFEKTQEGFTKAIINIPFAILS